MRSAQPTPFRRLVVLLLLLSGAAPVLLELVAHGGPMVSVVHVESASTFHHADNCVVNVATRDRAAPLAVVPTVSMLAEPECVVQLVSVLLPPAVWSRAASSRSPPALSA